jgi:ABC-type antimicrobial peptide transport system permease subunit
VAINSVNAGYFPAMRIRVVKGRVFGPEDNETSLRVAVVNETLARQFWPGLDAIGQELMPGVQVVGIVNDVRQEALQTDQGPAFYLPFEQRDKLAAAPNFVLVRTTGHPEELADALRASVQSLNPSQPVMDVQTMEQVLIQSVNQRLLLTTLMCGFAVLAIVIAAAGVYGVLSYVVSGQTREIGIRLCLGATRTDVVCLIGSQLAIAASVGLVCGVVATWLGARALSSWLFSVAADDITTFGAATLITLLAALVGATVPLGRALRVDPATAVRAE